MNGDIPFNAIEDRTREIAGGDEREETTSEYFDNWLNHFTNCWKYYKMPLWKEQEKYIEIWVEKQALQSLFREITDKHNVILSVGKGYPSLTHLYEATQRISEITDKGIQILYFGDFDPSGEDIYRNIQETLEKLGLVIKFEKIAITKDQIEKYDLPPLPSKKSDSRARKFIEQYGDKTVELDAIEPNILQEIIKKAILKHFHSETYEKVKEIQEQRRKEIEKKIKEVLGD